MSHIIEQSSKPLLEVFHFSKNDKHYFEQLNASYWDPENILVKNYQYKLNNLPKKLNEESKEKSKLDLAYKILLNPDIRFQYCKYLIYQYSISQPNTLYQLINNYYSIIFPFYIFLLKNNSNDDLLYLVIDNINFIINIYEKTSLKYSFEIDIIKSLNIKGDSLEIQNINNKNIVTFYPAVTNHVELIYVLIKFMVTIKRKNIIWKKEISKVNEINQNLEIKKIKTIFDENESVQNKLRLSAKIHNDIKIDINKFKILTDDSFVPKSTKIFTYISRDKNNKKLHDKYLVLGHTYIYIFSCDQLRELCNIIPISPGYAMFYFDIEERGVHIKAGTMEYLFFFEYEDVYKAFKNKLDNIFEGNYKLFDSFDSDELLNISISFYNNKFMGKNFENTPIYGKYQKDIKLLENKLEELKNAKIIMNENDNLMLKIIEKKNNEDIK